MTAKNPYKKYEDLFEGWPCVQAWPLRGENGMCVAGRHTTPAKIKTCHNLTLTAMVLWAALLGFGLYAAYPYIQYNVQYNADFWAKIALIVWIVFSGMGYFSLAARAQKDTLVYFSPSHIQFDGRIYDARVQHKFSMDVHKKAKEEADAELRSQQRGKGRAGLRHPKYYRKGFHIYFEYLGQRLLVTDIHDEEYAEKLLRALVAVDRIIHKEKTVFSVNANVEESPGAAAERLQGDYFGRRPALD